GKIVDLIDSTLGTDENEADPEPSDGKGGLTKEDIRERNEVRCNAWWRSYALCERIVKESKSARFSAAAAFALGMRDWSRGSRGRDTPPNQVSLKEACDYCETCEKSDGSSRYLKGLAAYHRLLAMMEGTGKNEQLETKKQAEKLFKDYAGTAIASKAQAV